MNKRARTLMERMAAKPTAGVPQACRGWGETMAAYRFFDNDEVEWSAILEPHWQQTERRMAAQSVVLCLQDTTELDFNARQATGLGPRSYEVQRGMYLHPTYAGKRGGIKESQRWIEDYERVAEAARNLPHTRLAQELGTPADWLIRSTHDRALPEGAKLWACASEGEPLGEIAFTVRVRANVAATCLVAREFDAPANVKPIEWRLLTNREATTLQEAIELIDWYRARWEIEILFNVLKPCTRYAQVGMPTVMYKPMACVASRRRFIGNSLINRVHEDLTVLAVFYFDLLWN
ncbi:hypothetical protein DFQ28_011523 [Apophysomyces sp. BC1034]|nr:hypothetical protein DFQ30_011222 [Apophysomyces sp. BC1015]KAG0184243.1 hypothetical protein DFQ28_011523 [Apophysomyces sp. BC1034]